jgi:hypothetical protein
VAEFMPLTDFDLGSVYSAEVDDEGLRVYSECCSDLMSLSTAKILHEALGRWIIHREKENRS